jgi:hypothetical protein
VTEDEICRIYELTLEQVAAARAYVLRNPDTVLAEHLRIEASLTAENPPEVKEQAARARSTFASFKEWLRQKEAAASCTTMAQGSTTEFPTFRQWLAKKSSE